jgi:hypothetical protein
MATLQKKFIHYDQFLQSYGLSRQLPLTNLQKQSFVFPEYCIFSSSMQSRNNLDKGDCNCRSIPDSSGRIAGGCNGGSIQKLLETTPEKVGRKL